MVTRMFVAIGVVCFVLCQALAFCWWCVFEDSARPRLYRRRYITMRCDYRCVRRGTTCWRCGIRQVWRALRSRRRARTVGLFR